MNKNKSTCKLCDRLISTNNITKHEKSCAGKITLKYELCDTDKFKCLYCDKIFKSENGVGVHYWRSHTDEGKSFRPGVGHIGWNKGLTKETSDILKSSGLKIREAWKSGKLVWKLTDAGREKLSNLAKTRHLGGYKQKKWKNIRYEKDGEIIYLDSKYELLVARELDENLIKWIRPKSLKYKIHGKEKQYFADFYLPEYDVYLDPKNEYLIKKDTEKIRLVMKHNKVKVLIIDKNHLSWKNIHALVV